MAMQVVRHIPSNPVFRFFALVAVAWGFVSCQRHPAQPQVRPVLLAAYNSANQALKADTSIDRARGDLDSVFNRHRPLSNDEQLLQYEFYHSYYTSNTLRDYANGNRIADSALLLFNDQSFKAANLADYGNWILNKGHDLVQLKRLSEAFTYYYQVKSDYLANWDSCSLSRFTSHLGYVRYKQQDYRQAIRFYQQAYAQFCACTAENPIDDYYEAVTEPQGLLNGLAFFYELVNQPDSAFHYYHQALAFLERGATRFPDQQKATSIAQGVVYGNLGGLYNTVGNYEKAQHYLTQSVAINSQPGYDHRDVQTAQLKLAALYLNTGRPADAKQVIDDCRKGLDLLPSEEVELRWRQIYWKYQKVLGNLPASYTALQAYVTFKDSVEALNRDMFRADFTRAFEQRDQQLAYAKLAYENKLSIISLVIILVVLILVLVIVYLVYTNWKRSKQHIVRLNTFNDRISDRNEELQLALLALQDSQQENTRLMAMVAHDLRNPLTNIKLGVDYILQAQQRADNVPKVSMLTIIQKSNNRALVLIDEFMHRYTSEVSTTSNDKLDLSTMLLDCVEMMQLRAAKKDQQLTYQGESAIVRGSREKIWRVMANLIENAIKFTPVHGQITVRLRHTADEAIVEVQDSGIGIDPVFQGRLFEIDRPVGRKGTNGEPTTGLGLAIVKQIVTAHNGRIHFTSALHRGTTFYVHLPFSVD